MNIKLVAAVTDWDWFNTLRQQPNLDEVNFWSPSPNNFRALQPGELFLFKLHAPYNMIAGGGVFTHASVLPCSLAWEVFGKTNGADSLRQMCERIARYRRNNTENRDDFDIGCRILAQPFFFRQRDWIPVPRNWSPNIVQLKTYDTADTEGLKLWEAVYERLNQSQLHGTIAEQQARFGKPVLIRPRRGQGAFRILVRDIYQRRCAITQERTLPTLEAAHIRPYRDGGLHEPKNGLLLRRDIHALFDAGYVTITPDLHFEASSRIREEFDNGKPYYALHGQSIIMPKNTEQRPDRAALSWHNENCYKG